MESQAADAEAPATTAAPAATTTPEAEAPTEGPETQNPEAQAPVPNFAAEASTPAAAGQNTGKEAGAELASNQAVAMEHTAGNQQAAATTAAAATTTTPEAKAPRHATANADEQALREAKMAYLQKARAALNSLQAALQEADAEQNVSEQMQAQVDDIIRSMPTLPNPPTCKQEICSPQQSRSPPESQVSAWSQDAQDPNEFLRRRLSFSSEAPEQATQPESPKPALESMPSATKSKGPPTMQVPETSGPVAPKKPSLPTLAPALPSPPPKCLATPVQQAMPLPKADAQPIPVPGPKSATPVAFRGLPSACAAAPWKAAAPKAPPPSEQTIHKRLLRVMEPNQKGDFKVSKQIRDQFKAGGEQKKHVFKLFAACNNDPDRVVTVLDHAWQYKLEFDVLNEWFNSCPCKEAFIRKFSATSESSQELEVSVEFEFMTKQEMADDDMSPNLDSIRISYFLSPMQQLYLSLPLLLSEGGHSCLRRSGRARS